MQKIVELTPSSLMARNSWITTVRHIGKIVNLEEGINGFQTIDRMTRK